MSGRLLEVLRNYLVVHGNEGLATLSGAVDRHQVTVERWIKTGRIPSPNYAYKLALACGCTPEDSLDMAKDSPKAKDTA